MMRAKTHGPPLYDRPARGNARLGARAHSEVGRLAGQYGCSSAVHLFDHVACSHETPHATDILAAGARRVVDIDRFVEVGVPTAILGRLGGLESGTFVLFGVLVEIGLVLVLERTEGSPREGLGHHGVFCVGLD